MIGIGIGIEFWRRESNFIADVFRYSSNETNGVIFDTAASGFALYATTQTAMSVRFLDNDGVVLSEDGQSATFDIP